MMLYVFKILFLILDITWYALIISVVMSWLFAFGVIYPGKYMIVDRLNYIVNRIVDPIVEPIRNILPAIGGLDFSALVAMLVLKGLSIGLTKYYLYYVTHF